MIGKTMRLIDAERELRRLGFEKVRTGDHLIFKNFDKNLTISLPMHKFVSQKTWQKEMKRIGAWNNE